MSSQENFDQTVKRLGHEVKCEISSSINEISLILHEISLSINRYEKGNLEREVFIDIIETSSGGIMSFTKQLLKSVDGSPKLVELLEKEGF